MTQSELLQRIKERLQTLYGARFRGLVLYGSVARGDADEDSDIDLLALLEGPVNAWKEIRATTRATYSLQLEYLDRVFHIMPVEAGYYEKGTYALHREARREGVAV